MQSCLLYTSSLGGVYKLSALEKDGEMIPKIKLSENKGKITNPGYKKVLRIYDKAKHKALADLICLDSEQYDEDVYKRQVWNSVENT